MLAQALGELLGVRIAVAGTPGVAAIGIVLRARRCRRGIVSSRLGRSAARSAAEETADGMTDGRSDCDTTSDSRSARCSPRRQVLRDWPRPTRRCSPSGQRDQGSVVGSSWPAAWPATWSLADGPWCWQTGSGSGQQAWQERRPDEPERFVPEQRDVADEASWFFYLCRGSAFGIETEDSECRYCSSKSRSWQKTKLERLFASARTEVREARARGLPNLPPTPSARPAVRKYS